MRELVGGIVVLTLGRGPLSANAYLVRSGPSFVLIDTGWPGSAAAIRRSAEAAFGPGARPAAILLTHLHPDHSGSARELARAWEVPVLVHPRELPLAAGYVPEFANPLDRRVVLPLLHRLPRGVRQRIEAGSDDTDLVQALDPDGPPPGLPDWECVPTPGHTPGSVSFRRPRDRLLVTGDALLTVDLTAPSGLVLGRRRLAPPLRFTDWDRTTTLATIASLAALGPRGVLAGHGHPVVGPAVPGLVRTLADRRSVPPG
jgi:glyoxylase-like metal-dependent hydrolase (beta-lactamase superfamily II)